MQSGIEPDNCFYIENEAKVRGKNRLDLTIDSCPDLALEIDLTYRSNQDIYAKLGLSELWQFDNQGNWQINILNNGIYQPVEFSPYFPKFPLKDIIPLSLKKLKKSNHESF